MDSTQPDSIASATAWLRKGFRSDAAAGLRIVYAFDLKGERGGSLWVHIDDGRLEIAAGRPAEADVTFELTAADFFGVLAGSENPDLLFMADRLVVHGDLGLALKLRKIFQARG